MRDIEERLSRPSALPVERERDVRMLGVLVRTLRDLSLFDAGAPGEAPPPEHDPVPKDMDEFRYELARRIRSFIEQRQKQRKHDAGQGARGDTGTS